MLLSGLRWVAGTVATAVNSELNDGAALRQALLDAGVRYEQGEISEEEFVRLEEEVLERIRAVRAGSAVETGPIEWTGEVEAGVVGDFHAADEKPGRMSARRR